MANNSSRRKRSIDRPATIVSLFCGCGGFDLGFSAIGFRTLIGLDVDPVAVETFNQRGDRVGEVADLSAVRSLGLSRSPDIVIAGPPCQGFSTLGKRLRSDPRNSLIESAAKLAVELKPRVIVIENVAGAASGELSQFWERAVQIVRNAGFKTKTLPVVSADFGVAQIRRRIVLMAWRGKSDDVTIEKQPPVFLSSALRGIDGLKNHEPKILNAGSDDFAIALQIGPHQKLCNVRAGDRSIPTWDIPEVFGKTTKQERQVLVLIRQLRRQIRVRDSGDADPVRISDIAKHVKGDVKRVVDRLHKNGYLRKFGQRFDLAHAFNGKYRRLAWDQLAPAVDTRFGEPRYFLHPEEQRGLSVREAARIQGFPDDFMFEGPRSAQYRMVGNAVPPPLAKQIAIAVRDQLL